MYCKKCGSELPDNYKFCSKCGNPVSEDDLDTKLKKQQYENEKSKSGCMTILMGIFVSGVLLFTAGPVFAGIALLIFMIGAGMEWKKK